MVDTEAGTMTTMEEDMVDMDAPVTEEDTDVVDTEATTIGVTAVDTEATVDMDVVGATVTGTKRARLFVLRQEGIGLSTKKRIVP